MDRQEFINELLNRLNFAESKYDPINTLHQGYAIILEEVDELWDYVRLKHTVRPVDKVLNELVDIAAMAMRTAVDLYEHRQQTEDN